ncbi:MAG: universal stress protein [Burkholderiales bacterium]|nr:universal stress protein [Burkholderiales bacterium]
MLIMLPVDGTELSLDAARHLINLVRRGLSARVLLANVQDAPHLYEVVLAPDPETLDAAADGAGQHALQAAGELLSENGITWTSDIGHGDPARVLLDLADRHGCEAIVMGSGRPGILSNARLGSVAQAVVQHATIPVTIVRHAEPEAELDEDAGTSAP